MLVADLADADAVEAVADQLPDSLDSVVHAAGVVELGPGRRADHGRLAVAAGGQPGRARGAHPARLPALRAARGTVVFVNSGAGLVAHPQWSAYAASKFGLRALADSLRAEEQEHGVRVTTVYPGRTATPMQQKVHAQEGKEYDAVGLDRPRDRGRRDPARAGPARRRDGQRPDDPAALAINAVRRG